MRCCKLEAAAAASAAVAAACVIVLRARSRARRERERRGMLPEISIQFAGIVPAASRREGEAPGDESERISMLDSMLIDVSLSIPVVLRFDVLLDEERVREGLAKALDVFPAYGARLETDKDSNDSLLVLRTDDNGAFFESAVGRTRGARLPDHTDSVSAWSECGLSAQMPSTEGSKNALVSVKLVVFPEEGVSYLGVSINHCLSGASNIVEFLHAWSKLCHTDYDPAAPELARRSMGKRVFGPRLPIKNEKELHEYHDKHIGGFNPLDLWAFRRTLPKLMWSLNFDTRVDLLVSESGLRRYKEAVQTRLRQDDPTAWVSSYEVMMATLMCLRAEQDATSWFSWGYDRRWKRHHVHVAVNVRGRAPEYPETYVGNAAMDSDMYVTVPRDLVVKDFDACVAYVSKQLHDALRARLADPHELTKKKHWLECAKAIGAAGWEQAFWVPMLDALRDSGTFCNSWKRYPWLEVDMGSGEKAVTMKAHFFLLRNLTVEVPCHRPSGTSSLCVVLPASTSERIRQRWSDLALNA